MDKLIENMAEVLDIETNEIDANFDFKESQFWDSLAQISLLAAVDDEFDVIITDDDLNSVKTITELLQLIQSKS